MKSTTRSMARKVAKQRGSVPLFFVTFVLPLLFFLLSLSLDVGTYFSERANTQKVLDDVAMYAYRFLPYQSQAQSATASYVGRYGPVGAGISLTFPADGVELRVSRTFPLMFATMFGLPGAGLPLVLTSRVRGVSSDVYVSLDVTATVAPPQTQSAPLATQWGDQNTWPASNYFNAPQFGQAVTNPEVRRILTQQCFNPVFAGLKRSAIEVVDYLGGFSLNSIGIGMDNGNLYDPLELIRSVRGSLPLPQSQQTNQDATFANFKNNLVSNIDCVGVAERSDAPDQFKLPQFSGALPVRGNFSGRPSTLIDPATGQVNATYLPYLQGREVLWGQVARGGAGGSTATLVMNALTQVLLAPPVPGRAGLKASAKKVLIFFASDLPRQGSVLFQTSSDAAGQALHSALVTSVFPYVRAASTAGVTGRVELLYVLLQSPSVPDRSVGAAALQSFFDAERATANLTTQQFYPRVIYVSDPQVLTEQVLAALAIMNSTSVVSL